MRLAIVGSRTFRPLTLVKEEFNDFVKREEIWHNPEILKEIEIVSGGAAGPDTEAFKISKEYNLPYKVFYPEWDKFGKVAGFERNSDIVRYCDFALVFWDGHSNGTADTIRKLMQMGTEFNLIQENGKSFQYRFDH